MNYLLALLAGAVQGLTEFLPISSTGHLIIFENLFKISQNDFGLAFDASLHLGTLLAVLFFFSKDYLKIFYSKNSLLKNLIIGTIPAVILGLIFESQISSTLRDTTVVGLALIFGSVLFILAEKLGKKQKVKEQTTPKDAAFIGLFQALALIPGISRSGSTIAAGLFLGLKREEAAKFAFLLSGPIIAGAGVKKFLEVIANGGITEASNLTFFIIGIFSSFLFGYLTIKYFLQYLSSRTLYPFVIYRVIVGLLILFL